MTPTKQLVLSIKADPETDAEELEELTRQLREEIMELDVESADFAGVEEVPAGAKVVEPISLGTVLVTLLATGGVITTLINAIQAWLTRHERQSITIEIDGDKLEITGISDGEKQQLVNAWIHRHTTL